MILVNLQLKIDPAVREEFSQWFRAILPDTRSYVGCSGLYLVEVEGDADAFEVVSQWESKAHYDDYLNWRTESGDLDELGKYLAADPAFRFLPVLFEL
jgi:quinol monooxygenase YgiN